MESWSCAWLHPFTIVKICSFCRLIATCSCIVWLCGAALPPESWLLRFVVCPSTDSGEINWFIAWRQCQKNPPETFNDVDNHLEMTGYWIQNQVLVPLWCNIDNLIYVDTNILHSSSFLLCFPVFSCIHRSFNVTFLYSPASPLCRFTRAWTSSPTRWRLRRAPSAHTTWWASWIRWSPATQSSTSGTKPCLSYPFLGSRFPPENNLVDLACANLSGGVRVHACVCACVCV